MLFAALVLVATKAPAYERFPDQPHIQEAYNKVSSTIKILSEGSESGNWDASVGKALPKLGEARAELDTAKKNKGSARGAAMELIDQAVQLLSTSHVTRLNLDKSIQICKEALEKIVRAGKAGR